MDREKFRKILKWTAIALGVIVIAVGGWVSAKWFGSGSVYGGEPEDILPKGALLVVRADNLRTNRATLDAALESLFEQRESFRQIEMSPLWRKLSDPPLTVAKLRADMNAAHDNAAKAVAGIPVLGLELGTDFLAGPTVMAVYPPVAGGGTRSLVMVRVSRAVDFGLGFSGFATGTHGNSTIASQGDGLAVTTTDAKGAATTMHIRLLDDVLCAASDAALITEAAANHKAKGGGFSAHPQYAKAVEELKATEAETSAYLRVYCDLGVVRAEQLKSAPPGTTVAPIDEVFSISPAMARLSPEIMPSIRKIVERAVDTRAFTLAAWSVCLDYSSRVQVDQFLIADPGRIKSDYQQVTAAWSAPQAEMDFLGILPSDVWLLGTARHPFSDLREAIKPGRNPDGSPQKDTVALFLDALGPNPAIDSVGIALFGRSLSPDPTAHRDRLPSVQVSPVPLPGFALFMHWPGVTQDSARSLMGSVLRSIGAERIKAVDRQTSEGNDFVTFDVPADLNALRWIGDLSCFALRDHLVVAYSVDHAATGRMFTASRSPEIAFGKSRAAPWSLPQLAGAKHSAVVYVDPSGLNAYSGAVRLAPELAERTYSSSSPFGKDLPELRKELAADMSQKEGKPVDWTDDRVGAALEAKQREWVAKRGPFQLDLEQNLRAFTAVTDFTALTRTTLERMHTRFIIRLR